MLPDEVPVEEPEANPEPDVEDEGLSYTPVISKPVYSVSFILTQVIPFLIVLVLFTHVLQFYYVPSGSMLPTLNIGEVVLCTAVHSPSDVHHGDIVVFSPFTAENNYLGQSEDNREELYVKRLIGLPGDTVSIQNHTLYVNGEPVDEPYLSPDLVMEDYGEITVPDGCYFMMGDNRNNSADCRYIGSIPFENLKARCFFHMNSIAGFLRH